MTIEFLVRFLTLFFFLTPYFSTVIFLSPLLLYFYIFRDPIIIIIFYIPYSLSKFNISYPIYLGSAIPMLKIPIYIYIYIDSKYGFGYGFIIFRFFTITGRNTSLGMVWLNQVFILIYLNHPSWIYHAVITNPNINSQNWNEI